MGPECAGSQEINFKLRMLPTGRTLYLGKWLDLNVTVRAYSGFVLSPTKSIFIFIWKWVVLTCFCLKFLSFSRFLQWFAKKKSSKANYCLYRVVVHLISPSTQWYSLYPICPLRCGWMNWGNGETVRKLPGVCGEETFGMFTACAAAHDRRISSNVLCYNRYALMCTRMQNHNF